MKTGFALLSFALLAPLASFSSACLTSYVKPPDGQPAGNGSAAPQVGSIPEMDEKDMAAIAVLLGCTKSMEGFFCRALVAFPGGEKPTGHPQEVSFAGASALIPAPGSPDDGKPVAYEASYFVLSDASARYGTLLPTTAEERASTRELFLAVTKGEPLPSDNSSVQYAKTIKGAFPASPTERSLAWNGKTKGYVRMTKMGLVAIEVADGLIAVGVFPTK